MPTWATIIDDNFNRANTSTGGAGTTTGVGNGWIDVFGGIWNILSNQLHAAASGTGINTGRLARPTSEDISDSRMIVDIAAGKITNAVWDVDLRWRNPGSSYVAYCSEQFGTATFNIAKFISTTNSPTTISGGTFAVDNTHAFSIEFYAFGISPTTLYAQLVDTTTSTVIATIGAGGTVTDNEATLQAAGTFNICASNSFGGSVALIDVTRIQTFGPVTSLGAGTVSLLGETDTQVQVQTSGGTGGTGPYTYQWYRGTVSTFTPGAGNILTGKTSAICTDTTVVAKTLYWYKVIVTDAVAATATSAAIAAMTSQASQVWGYVGDSITAGLGGGHPDLQEVSLLQVAGGGRSIVSVNAAVSGSMTADWLPGQSDYTAAVTLFNANSVTIINLMLGTNDSRVADSVTPTTYGSNMAAICAGFLVDVPTCTRIYVNYSPYVNILVSGGEWTDASLALLQQYQPKIDALDNKSTIRVADKYAFQFFADNVAQLVDGIHPNGAGGVSLGTLWAFGAARTEYSSGGGSGSGTGSTPLAVFKQPGSL